MGLQFGDLEKVPEDFSTEECYKRIWELHKKYGIQRLKVKYQKEDAYSKTYLDLLDNLPSPDKATESDVDFVFGEVIFMLMEWSYHEEDDHGIKMGAYAHFAINKRYAGIEDVKFKNSREKSLLFKRFSNWRDTKRN